MNVIFQDTLRPSLNSSHSQSSAVTQSFCTSRQFVDQLKRFIQVNDPPSAAPSSSGLSLSDVGFLLLRLKDQLLSSAYFPAEFVSRPYNGIDVLVKVVVVLQNIVNSAGSSSKLSSLLTRTNSSASRRRKAAVSVRLSVTKIFKPNAWNSLLDNPTNLDVILYSVHSPQLDSKCYALEIIILLLDQPHGFIVLFRSLSYIAARNRDFLRLSIFISQLKHGLHTSKLHIQILVVRLLNKLLQQAPSAAHRIMAQTDAILSNFSPEHLEKGQTSVTKNIERQRLKRNGEGYGANNHLSSRLLLRLLFRQESCSFSLLGYPPSRFERIERFDRPEFGGMRRAKSESAMAMEDETLTRCLKQQDEFPDCRQVELSSKLSRSIHDLSRDQTLTEIRPGSATMTRSLRRNNSPPRARFAEPLVDNKPAAIQGFSYLFPKQPVISSVSTRQRARTPDPYGENEGVTFESPRSPDYSSSAYPVPAKTNDHLEKVQQSYVLDTFLVVYIPINTPNDDGSTSLRSRLRSPGSYTGTIGDDVKDALSQFDYLNDYDVASTKCASTTYHF
ncbi:unnamed protein product [Enterobius vermicularis]|uniref:DUF5742 domain-containing protein n=1 Tax=Enterobius vermicularis TaxID=51028 RepID=A0A0N4VLG3_ENTVE|nr:unnamed protein product [Enterobius vermicularis]